MKLMNSGFLLGWISISGFFVLFTIWFLGMLQGFIPVYSDIVNERCIHLREVLHGISDVAFPMA